MIKELMRKIEETIETHRMLSAGDTVLVALSGGPDSVCLLDVLEKIKRKFAVTICVAHFNHKLRGEAADQDAKFAEKIAQQRSLPFVASSADVRAFANEQKLSIEAAGRKLRYEFLLRSSLTLGANKVAMGHTADDQAETILMRLIRGSGPDGLGGIPPVRSFGNLGEPKIIRPLIRVWRHEIMQYIRSHKLEYCMDATNESPEYLRNKIRLELLPHLEKEYNPRIKERLAGTASALAAENDFMETEAGLLAREMIVEKKPGWIVFSARTLTELHHALRKRVIAQLASMTKPDAPMLEASHYLEADALLFLNSGRLDLPGGLRLEVSNRSGVLSEVTKRTKNPPEAFSIAISGKTFIPSLNLEIKTRIMPDISSPLRLVSLCVPSRQYFDLSAVRPPLEVRVRRPGDSFNPLGVRGSKKLKDFFIDKKVPRFLRDRIPLLLSNRKIMWVMGYAIDKRFMLKKNSKAALRVDYERKTFGSVPE